MESRVFIFVLVAPTTRHSWGGGSGAGRRNERARLRCPDGVLKDWAVKGVFLALIRALGSGPRNMEPTIDREQGTTWAEDHIFF